MITIMVNRFKYIILGYLKRGALLNDQWNLAVESLDGLFLIYSGVVTDNI